VISVVTQKLVKLSEKISFNCTQNYWQLRQIKR